MESVRVHLDDGAYWDIKVDLTHGDRRRIEAAVQSWAVKMMSDFEAQGVDLAKLREQGAAMGGDAAWSPAEEDAHLQHCTVGWSFPEPVTQEAIEQRQERHVRKVLAEMRERYADVPESDEGKGTSGGPSSSPSTPPYP